MINNRSDHAWSRDPGFGLHLTTATAPVFDLCRVGLERFWRLVISYREKASSIFNEGVRLGHGLEPKPAGVKGWQLVRANSLFPWLSSTCEDSTRVSD